MATSSHVWTWETIEQALLSLPLELFSISLRAGVSEEGGAKIARIRIADALRRKLVQIENERNAGGKCPTCGSVS
jgi:hypothetical protein